MASSFQQWESDPLFSAAEVVQDSADRMESIFRLLFHDQSLVQGDHPDPRLLTSIEYHKRDLVTILETAKWQLEDFERAVSSLTQADKSQTRKNVISRHWQFIRAIKEQIYSVEKSVEGLTMGGSLRNSEWVNFNEQDGDVLASFLAGGNLNDNSKQYDTEDGSILRRFLDPTPASSLKGDEIIEYDSRELEKVKMNGDMHIDNYIDNVKENNVRKVGYNYSTTLGVDVANSAQEREGDGDQWDLEANGTAPRNFFHESKLRTFYDRINVFGFLNSLWSLGGDRVTRNYTKRLKDGEEQRHSPTYVDASNSSKGQHKGLRSGSGCRNFQTLCTSFRANLRHLRTRLVARDQSFPCLVRITRHSMQLTVTLIIFLMLLGILLYKIV